MENESAVIFYKPRSLGKSERIFMENPIKPTEYEPEFTASELEVMRAFAIRTGLPWSLELYQQANARLDRQGQKKSVIIERICKVY